MGESEPERAEVDTCTRVGKVARVGVWLHLRGLIKEVNMLCIMGARFLTDGEITNMDSEKTRIVSMEVTQNCQYRYEFYSIET